MEEYYCYFHTRYHLSHRVSFLLPYLLSWLRSLHYFSTKYVSKALTRYTVRPQRRWDTKVCNLRETSTPQFDYKPAGIKFCWRCEVIVLSRSSLTKIPFPPFSDTTSPHALSAHIPDMELPVVDHHNCAANHPARHTSDIGERAGIVWPTLSSTPIPWLCMASLIHKILHQISSTRRRCSEDRFIVVVGLRYPDWSEIDCGK